MGDRERAIPDGTEYAKGAADGLNVLDRVVVRPPRELVEPAYGEDDSLATGTDDAADPETDAARRYMGSGHRWVTADGHNGVRRAEVGAARAGPFPELAGGAGRRASNIAAHEWGHVARGHYLPALASLVCLLVYLASTMPAVAIGAQLALRRSCCG